MKKEEEKQKEQKVLSKSEILKKMKEIRDKYLESSGSGGRRRTRLKR